MCISRPISRLSWGIPLPFDPAYVTYVWFDALVCYISIPAARGDAAARAWVGCTPLPPGKSDRAIWPADLHIIGKDILKFHAVYWPIMLKAMGAPLPQQLLVHGWWQKDGQKISKSTGVIVDPVEIIREWGLDAFRFYVVRELDIGPDGNWTDAGFAARYQSELANGLGNLINRSLSMLKRYRQGIVPAPSDELAPTAASVAANTIEHLRNYRLQDGLVNIWSLVRAGNEYVERTAPFRLAKDPAQAGRLDEVLYNLCECCRVLAVLLAPYLPDTAARILKQLGLPEKAGALSEAAWGGLKQGHVIGEPAPLFPRKDLEAKKA